MIDLTEEMKDFTDEMKGQAELMIKGVLARVVEMGEKDAVYQRCKDAEKAGCPRDDKAIRDWWKVYKEGFGRPITYEMIERQIESGESILAGAAWMYEQHTFDIRDEKEAKRRAKKKGKRDGAED